MGTRHRQTRNKKREEEKMKIKTAKRTAKPTLKKVQKFLSKIPNINGGGCGVSALALYRWIKNNLEIENTKFVFLYDNEDRYLNNAKILRNKKGKAEAPTHCCLLYKGKFIDSDGERKVGKYNWLQIIDEEEFITKALDNIWDWNHSFDREYIDEIEEKLDIDLSDIRRI